MIEITYTSQRTFGQVARDLLKLVPRVKERIETIAEEELERTRVDLRNAILNKDRSSFIKRLRSISPAWRDKKKAKGWKLHQLDRLDYYGNAIIIKRLPESIALTVKDAVYPGRKFKYVDLARFLEYGTRRMDPLPHWRKAAQFFKKNFTERVEGELQGVRVSR